MTDIEIHTKIQRLMVSDAPIDLIRDAIANLESQLSTSTSITIANSQITASQPDYSDIGQN